jgi:hypothetical protein
MHNSLYTKYMLGKGGINFIMMKKISRLFLFFFVFIACRSSRCVVDQGAVNEFEKHYNVIKTAEETKTEFLVKDYRNALLFLTNITGINTRAEYSSTVGYRNAQFYKEDMKTWRVWLDTNKCKLTRHYIDSTLAKVDLW